MARICVECGGKLNSWDKPGLCYKCKRKLRKVINIETTKRKKDYTLYDGTNELINSVENFKNNLIDDSLDVEKIVISLLKIVETCKCISDNMGIELSHYIEDFYISEREK